MRVSVHLVGTAWTQVIESIIITTVMAIDMAKLKRHMFVQPLPVFCSVPALRSKEFFTQNDKRIFQTAKWNDEHAVITSVTIFGAGQNDLEMRQAKWSLLVLLIVFTDQMFQFKQVLRTV